MGVGVGWLPSPEIAAARPQYHAQSIANIREAVESFATSPLGYRPVAIALDTKGPEIRTGVLQGVRGGPRAAGFPRRPPPRPRLCEGRGRGRGGGAREGVARGGSQGHSGPAPRARRPRWS